MDHAAGPVVTGPVAGPDTDMSGGSGNSAGSCGSNLPSPQHWVSPVGGSGLGFAPHDALLSSGDEASEADSLATGPAARRRGTGRGGKASPKRHRPC